MATRTVLIALTSAAIIAYAAGCGTSHTPNQTASANPSPTTSAPAGASASPAQPSPSPYVVLDLTIDKGTVTPTNATLQAKAGQPIVVRVTTDEYDELAVGSSPDLRFSVDPRGRGTQVFQFTIDVPGQVNMELFRKSGCPNACARTHQLDKTVATIQVQPSAATTTSPAPLSTGPTREPCELLSPGLAKAFAGDDARQQPSGNTECSYKGSTRSVSFTIGAQTSDPDAPVNHFHVIRPDNEIPGLAYKAYWFGPGESLVVVKNGLVLDFKVSDNPMFPNAQINQYRRAEDIRLADQIVPRVG